MNVEPEVAPIVPGASFEHSDSSPHPNAPGVAAGNSAQDADAAARLAAAHVSPPIQEATPLLGAVSMASSTTFLGGSFVVAILAVLIAVLLARRKTSKKGTDILLVGPTDAGKTALFSMLVHGRAIPSHTSMQPNIAVLPSSEYSSKKAARMRLVDVPGHPRLRAQGLQDHIGSAKAVIFVADASTVARNGAAVAEHLHSTLSSLAARPNTPPVAVVASKCDLAGSSTASGITRVRTVLERELDKRRASRVDVDGVGLGMEASNDESTSLGGLDTVGPPGNPFKFADWECGEIVVLGTSVAVGEKGAGSDQPEKDGLGQLREWIDGLDQ